MKKPDTQATQLLADAIHQREALDPHFFDDLKKASLKKAIELGVDPEFAKKLYSHDG